MCIYSFIKLKDFIYQKMKLIEQILEALVKNPKNSK